MILVLDNYDSFTYNLVQHVGALGLEPFVVRADQITPQEVADLHPSHIIISPGPGVPEEAGISVPLVQELGPHIPILGVCLGHQAIAVAYGGRVGRARRIMHGKTSVICHDGRTIFRGLPNPFEATRYHSLVACGELLPGELEVSAWTEFISGGEAVREIMGLRHRRHPVEGVQFHPESALTKVGKDLLKNFLGLA